MPLLVLIQCLMDEVGFFVLNKVSSSFAERAAKVAEQQERERSTHLTSPRAGTPLGALMGVVPPPTPMGMLNPSMTSMSGNPS